MTSAPVFCKNCKHYGADYRLADCRRTAKPGRLDLTDGFQYSKGGRDASEERSSLMPWKCGTKGRFFLARR